MKGLLRYIAFPLAGAFLAQCLWIDAQSASKVPTFQVNSPLTLVDVIAENANTGLRSREQLTDLKREDFRIFDNGHEMPIESFDIGAQNTTRPIALWLIVQCPQHFPKSYHSMFIRGKTRLLRPALSHLATDDVTGVAHWCDNGDSVIDLAPGHNPDAALAKVETILNQNPVLGTNRVGELAMQRMIRLILDETHQAHPSRLPVFLFLYGDGCATYQDEADRISRDLLETTGMVYGLNDGALPYEPRAKFPFIATEVDPGQRLIFYLVHYYSQQTGGEVYSAANPKLFSAALDYILTQLHFRYTIGFRPKKVDGKRHTLKVELTSAAEKRFPDAVLRYRTEYIPVVRPKRGPK